MKTIRVFVSSTFEDLAHERDALHARVYPKLRALCERHGWRFQPIDLRWGISEESSLDQRTMPICLAEIERCRQVTRRPNFIALLGSRYGWKPLPHAVPSTEFDRLLDALRPGGNRHDPDARELLTTWYRRDTNAVPTAHILQPRTGRFRDSDVWAPTNDRLQRSLIAAVSQARLESSAREKYVASATEQEIRHGVFDAADASECAHCFFLETEDVTGDRTSPARQLADLKARLSARFPRNVHIQPVRSLSRAVYRTLSKTIRQELKHDARRDPLDLEIAAHRAFGADRAQHFVGREAEIARAERYFREDRRHPLVSLPET